MHPNSALQEQESSAALKQAVAGRERETAAAAAEAADARRAAAPREARLAAAEAALRSKDAEIQAARASFRCFHPAHRGVMRARDSSPRLLTEIQRRRPVLAHLKDWLVSTTWSVRPALSALNIAVSTPLISGNALGLQYRRVCDLMRRIILIRTDT